MPDDRIGTLHVAERVWARIRSRGLGEVGRLMSGRLKEAVESGDTLVVFSLATQVEPSAAGEDLLFRSATLDDGDLYARDIGTESNRSFRGRLSPTTSCFVVESEGRLLHATWVTTSGAWTRELQGYVRPPQGSAYVYESFTHPDARGQGLYPFALRRIASHAAERDLDNLWVAIEAGNHSSLRAVAKAGFRPVFRLEYRRRWGRLTVGIPTPGEPGSAGLQIERS
ncbi:MAG: GNAT family N-acetyltransferase [Actinobacteria bacterium]|nr:GNAT family N-acetyltransferase [Actinomycetota bacterium]